MSSHWAALTFKLVLLIGLSSLSARALSQSVKLASKKFTENVILAEIARQILEAKGFNAEHRKELGSTRIVWEAMRRGEIDIYPDYSGTILHEILAKEKLTQADQLREALKAYNIGVTKPIGFNNTYAMGMRRSKAEALNITRISQLRDHSELVYGLGHEFLERADGWPGLRKLYGLRPQEVKGIDHDLGYKALESGAIDIIDLYTTDAEIEHYDLVALEDDRQYFPEYQAVFLYRLDLESEVVFHLHSLVGLVTEKRMIAMNTSSKIKGHSAEKVAQDFLRDVLDIESQVKEISLTQLIVQRTREHLFLVGWSLAFAIICSIPLGFMASRNLWLQKILLSTVGLIQTIPSLALLVVMIPIFGIGTLPALFALFLYSLLPIVRGTFYGFRNISSEVRESATALGLPDWDQFRRIFWPLALPSILNGIKTSAVINVGTATLGALVGAGGYGQTILRGIRLDRLDLILAGAIPAAVLALVIDLLFDWIENLTVSRGLRQ